MKTNFIIFCFILFCAMKCFAQDAKPSAKTTALIDSLQKDLLDEKEDTTKVNKLVSLSKALFTSGDQENSKKYALDAVALSDKLNFNKGKGNAYTRIGVIEQAKKNYSEALTNYKLSLEFRIQAADSIGIGNSYHNIGNTYSDLGNYTDALKNHQLALKIRTAIGDKYGLSTSYNNIAIINKMHGEYSEALNNHFSALKIRIEIKDSIAIANSYSNIGIIYSNMGNFPEALKYQLLALKIRERTGDKSGISKSYNSIGNIYNDQGNYPEALNNHFASLKLSEELKDKLGMASSYNNIGNLYLRMGNYDEALKYQQSCLRICEEYNEKPGTANAYNNIGNIYNAQFIYPEALQMHFKALEIRKAIGNKDGMVVSYLNIGNVYTKLGKYVDSRKYIDSALAVQKDFNSVERKANSYEKLTELDSATASWKNAYENYKLYIIYRDSLLNEENTKKTVRLQMQYDFDKKEDSTRAEQEKKDALANAQLEVLSRENEIQKLKVKNQQSQLVEASLLATKKENEIQILNQTQEIQELELEKQKSELKEQSLIAESKNKELLLLNKDNELKEKEITRQKLARNGLVIGLAIMFLFAGIFLFQRNRISKGKKRSDELLLNILPFETAEELKATGTAKAKSYDEVTVMFTDFKNFTQVSEKLTGSELVKEINYCYSEFDSIIQKHGIEKIKTIGDSYMCAGGLPVANKTNAIDTVSAALDIQKFMEKMKADRIKENKSYFEIRLGIHTGPVVAGIVGIKKFAYDIWGDTVNIASRMESSGEVGKVNISESTYLLVKNNYECLHRGKIDAKNKGMIDMYFVNGISANKNGSFHVAQTVL